MTTTTSTTRAGTSRDVAIHRAIRRAGRALAAAAETLRPDDDERMDAFVRYWCGHAAEIRRHRAVHDEIVVPAVRAPEAAELLAELDVAHHRLERVVEESRAAIEGVVMGAEPADAARQLHRLADMVDDHLDVEQRELVPLLGRHAASRHELLTGAAIATGGLRKHAAFTVPYVASWVSEDERSSLLATARPQVRALHRLASRRHARLVDLALGAHAPRRAALASER